MHDFTCSYVSNLLTAGMGGVFANCWTCCVEHNTDYYYPSSGRIRLCSYRPARGPSVLETENDRCLVLILREPLPRPALLRGPGVLSMSEFAIPSTSCPTPLDGFSALNVTGRGRCLRYHAVGRMPM